MLRIYADIQIMQDDVRALYSRIREHDADLARQLRRAAQSVALNTAEGMAVSGGMRRQAFSVALRETRETAAALDVAGRWGYVPAEPSVLDRLDKIAATLFKLTVAR